ncbi:MAG: hypothetical protein QHC67_10590 [Sphingobium sp.]|uniref:hypothetical protein n=1 Tax=Sphingobium sp. TaxID=1912891 RepID=UPI0029A5B2B7|nr:hypothetical protein [Sphingobium sp.]MDX3910253.1 hypothetical protein [Sphingobium sp.]
MTKPNPPAKKSQPDTAFNPIPLRVRHDGWTPERQTEFIDALAETGCVTDAARRVGLSRNSAYRLRADPEAANFRLAWDNALEFAVLQLQDAVMSRAIHGVAVPHYYQGQIVGEHRRYNDRLAQFLLRTRRPAFYGRPAEEVKVAAPSDLYAIALEHALLRLQGGVTIRSSGPDPTWLQGVPLYTLEAPPPDPFAPDPEAGKAAREELQRALDLCRDRLLAAAAEDAARQRERDEMGGDVVSPLSPSGDFHGFGSDPADTNP